MLPSVCPSLAATATTTRSLRPALPLQQQGVCCRPFTVTPRLPALNAQQDERGSPGPSSNASNTFSTLASRASPSSDDDVHFMEPLIRTLVLGISAGGLMEMFHVLSAANNAAGAAGAGLSMLPFLVPPAASALAPLYFTDHVVAIGVWVLLYLVEARAIYDIMDQHKDPLKVANTIRSTMTLPKRMLPISLTSAKRAVYKMMTGFNPAAVVASVTAARPSAFTPGDAARELARRGAARGGGGGGGASAGTAVLDRPPVKAPELKQGGGVFDIPAPPSRGEPPLPAPEPKELPKPMPEPPKPSPAPPSRGEPPLPAPGPPPVGMPLPSPVSQTSPMPSAPTARPASRPAKGPGETKEDKRAREIRERRAYLKDMWYCCGISAELKAGEPKEVKILGRTVVLFREEDTGNVRCMENLCPHRGAPLGQGWTKEVGGKTCVVCPYHAWAFDGEGKLRDVPAATRGQLPKRPMLDTYPVEEKGGFIWLYFGSPDMPADERVPIPWIPELEDPNWQPVYAEMEFDAPHWSTFDNALDMAHIHYVHNSSFGNPDKPEILDMNMERDTFGIKGSFKIHNKPVNKMWEWTAVPYVPVTVQGFLPMTSAVRITLAGGVQMITFVNTVPIDEKRSINRFCLIRNFATSPLLDGAVRNEMFKILGEDKVMVEKVDPDNMPVEYSLEPDLPQVAFRRLRQEWVDMGYAVEPASTTGHKGSLRT